MTSDHSLILELLNANGFLAVNKLVLKKLGPNKAIYLSALIEQYKYLENNNQLIDEEWFYLQEIRIEELTGIGIYSQRECRKKLKILGLLEDKRCGLPSRLYFKLNLEDLEDFLFGNLIESTDALGQDNSLEKPRTSPGKNQGLINKTKGNKTKIKNYNKKGNQTTQIAKFEKWWKLYPRKSDKQNAKKIWLSLSKKKKIPSLPFLKAKLEKQIGHTWKDSDQEYIPLPSTYLNNSRWNDEVDETPPKRKRTAPGQIQGVSDNNMRKYNAKINKF